MPTKSDRSVVAVARSRNRKLGPAAATYVSQATCPGDCPFLGSGCYAEHPPMAYKTTWKLNRSRERDPVAVAHAEARAVDRLPADRDLRLHVVGDSRTRRGTRVLARAAARYLERARLRHRRGLPVRPAVWTYTHAWRRVPRPDWGPVSVLASCETPRQALEAMRRGYAAALVVERFASERAYRAGGVTVVPCPSQTRGVACVDCGLCLRDDRLRDRRLVIGFAAHGASHRRAQEALRRVSLAVVR